MLSQLKSKFIQVKKAMDHEHVKISLEHVLHLKVEISFQMLVFSLAVYSQATKLRLY